MDAQLCLGAIVSSHPLNAIVRLRARSGPFWRLSNRYGRRCAQLRSRHQWQVPLALGTDRSWPRGNVAGPMLEGYKERLTKAGEQA